MSADQELARIARLEAPTMKELGSRLARFRAEKDMTITTLASLADVSLGLISQVERGQGNPSYANLVKLARALHVPVGSFFSDDPSDEDPAPVGPPTAEQDGARTDIVRSDARRRVLIGTDGTEYELLTPISPMLNETAMRRLAVYLARVPPNSELEVSPFRREGEIFLTVIEGQAVLRIDDAHVHELGAGDSLSWDAREVYSLRNPTDRRATWLVVATPPTL